MNLNLSPIQDELAKLEAIRIAIQTDLKLLEEKLGGFKSIKGVPHKIIVDVEKEIQVLKGYIEIVN